MSNPLDDIPIPFGGGCLFAAIPVTRDVGEEPERMHLGAWADTVAALAEAVRFVLSKLSDDWFASEDRIRVYRLADTGAEYCRLADTELTGELLAALREEPVIECPF